MAYRLKDHGVVALSWPKPAQRTNPPPPRLSELARVPLNDYPSWEWALFLLQRWNRVLEYCGLASNNTGKRSDLRVLFDCME
jgi:hypothetical protein